MPVKPYEQGVAGKTFAGMKLLRHNAKLKSYNMSYNKGRTIMRPWGTMQPDGTMLPWRDQNNRFGSSWFVQDMVCMGWGKDTRFTAFLEVEDADNWPGGSPLQIFFDDMRTHPDYKAILFDRPGNSFSPLDNPKACGFLKGLIIKTYGKEYKTNPIWGGMLILPPSARESFDELVNRELPNAESGAGNTADDPHGWNRRYVVGDPIGLETGKVFEWDKESNFESSQSTSGINLNGTGSGSGDRKDAVERYACRISPENAVLPLSEYAEKVMRYDQPFEEALRFLTGEEQINELIIPGFGRSCREAVLYSFGGKGLLPASFESGRVTVDMGKQELSPNGAQSAQPALSQQRKAAQSSFVNLDAGGDDQPSEEPPFEPDSSMDGPSEEEVTPPSSGTAESIRARLASAASARK